MKSSRKTEHCIFVEEETYNWAPSRLAMSTRALIVITLMMTGIAIVVSMAG